MRYYLSEDAVLKWIEQPSVYNVKTDDLYELDEESFVFLIESMSEEGAETPDEDFTDFCLSEGILVFNPVRVRRPILRRSPVPSMRYLELQITDRCNLRCRHCYIGRDRHSELPINRITGVLREFEEMQGLRVMITGGEPLLHSSFNEINEMLSSFAVRKILLTNGILLQEDVLETLNVEEIQVSIDGLERGHDYIRGPGTFRKAMDAVHRAMDAGFDVSVATMAHSMNRNDFNEMELLLRDAGVKDWSVDVPCPAGNLLENRELLLSPKEGGKYLGYGFGDGLHCSSTGFACGLHLMAVLADGTAAKCGFYSDSPVGGIEDGLLRNWR